MSERGASKPSVFTPMEPGGTVPKVIIVQQSRIVAMA